MRKREITMVVLLSALCAPGAIAQDSEEDRIRAHYERVEHELRTRDVSSLTPAQREARERTIEVFRAYRLRRAFGENRDFPHQRVPHFVDAAGRRCAVANLLDHSGLGAMTLRIAEARNHAWVVDLARDTELLGWLARSGLTLAEAARIQVPGSRRIGIRLPPPTVNPLPEPFPDRDRAPAVARGRTPATGRPAQPRPRTPVAQPGRVAPGTRPAGMPTWGQAPTWRDWWRFERLAMLRPTKLGAARGPVTGTGDVQHTGQGMRRAARARVAGFLHAALTDDRGVIRAAATVAAGRLGDASTVPLLLRQLRDRNRSVRSDALLALGATGSGRGLHALLEIARTGKHGDIALDDEARAFALVAVGLARRSGVERDMGGVVAAIVRSTRGRRKRVLGTGALLGHLVAPSPALHETALTLLKDKELPTDLRCRAVEALATRPELDAVAALTRAVSGRDREARRSAAVALGRNAHELALPPLQTAFELERERLTRGLLLVAVGRNGGPGARDFLIEQVRRGRKTLRRWAALGLGLAARGRRDVAACRVLREAYAKEGARGARGAYLVASGLARDPVAVRTMLRVLDDSGNAQDRVAAADALALVGGDVARRALRDRIAKDPCGATRTWFAQLLGLLGDPADTDLLLDLLQKEKHADGRRGLALALGYSGAVRACRALETVAQDDDSAASLRAAAIESLGLMLSERPAFVLAALVRGMNFHRVPDWITRVVTRSL